MVHVCSRSMVGLILTSMVGLQVWWLRSMVGADADPPTAHGRCWVTAEQLGMWPLDHGCCSFIPRVENKKRFLQMPLRKAIFTCFFRSYRDLCKYIYLTIEYNSLRKKTASVFPTLCPNTQHLLVIRQKYLHQNQVVCEPTKFQSNTPNPPANPPCA